MKTIKLTNGKTVLVDDEDYEHLSKFRWMFSNGGYAWRSWYGKGSAKTRKSHHEIMHRLIVGLGKSDGVHEVDHINGNRLDNRRSNLRVCLKSHNRKNRRINKNNASGFKGVDLLPGGKWRAQIQYDGKQKNLGRFESPELAHEFYCLAADMMHGEFAAKGELKFPT
ncbi:HNH endonuclease [Burkholderia mayonis]|uniref:HNH endonuclease n=1 Tax=Burkholderia mayonis TaxID=1385591 RepID=UPI000D3C7836|nr:HNH endonuclease [Burkholderia mayonis]